MTVTVNGKEKNWKLSEAFDIHYINIMAGSVGGDWKEFKLEGTSGDHQVRAPCSKQSQLEQFADGHIHLASEYLQEFRLHNLSQ